MKQLTIGIFALLVPLAAAAPASSQCPDRHRPGAAALLSIDDWSRTSARRLHALGLTPPGFDPAANDVTIGYMDDVLRFAEAHEPDGLDGDAAGLRKRFEAQYPTILTASSCKSAAMVTVGGRVSDATGVVTVGTQLPSGAFAAPVPRPDATDVGAVVSAVAGIPHLAVFADLQQSPSPVVQTLGITAQVGDFGIIAGRVTPGYHTTESGAVVLQGTAAFDGVGVFLERPAHAPGFLRKIGPIGFQSMVASATEQPGNYDTWFLTARLSLEPWSWMGVNVTRGAYITSLKQGTPPTLADLARTAVGQNRRDSSGVNFADNQVVAVDGWFRSPTPHVPLTFYWDWGADDSAGAWWKVAGRVFGLRTGRLPGLRHTGMGIERTVFDHPTQSHGPWYRHGQMPEGWSEKGVLLGHPLGGHGRETLGYITGDIVDGLITYKVRGYKGVRGDFNVYAPTRAGAMHGGDITLSALAANRLRVTARASEEKGATWVERHVDIGADYRFR